MQTTKPVTYPATRDHGYGFPGGCKMLTRTRTPTYPNPQPVRVSKPATIPNDYAMPAFCKDWVESGDNRTIVQYIQHSEQRIRLLAQKVWCDII